LIRSEFFTLIDTDESIYLLKINQNGCLCDSFGGICLQVGGLTCDFIVSRRLIQNLTRI